MEEKRIRLSEQDVAESFSWKKALEKSQPSIVLAVAGLVLVSAGILSFLIFQPREPEIEISSVEEELSSTLWVDLEGAVEKPGVYELPSGSKLNDLLIQAGGFSAEADREWAEKNLNLAQRLNDGVKIYIPRESEAYQSWPTSGDGQVAGLSASLARKININTASANELDSLWGIGTARAAAIIEGRPYSSPEELLSRKIIPSNVYERIKEEITVF